MTEPSPRPRRFATLLLGFTGTAITGLILLGLAVAMLQAGLTGELETLTFTSWLAASLAVLGLAGAAALSLTVARRAVDPNRLGSALLVSLAISVIGFAIALIGYDLSLLPPIVAAFGHGLAFGGSTSAVVIVLYRSVGIDRLGVGSFLHGIWIAPMLALVIEALLAIAGLVIAVSAFAATQAGREWLNSLPEPSVMVESPLQFEQVAPLLSQPASIVLAVLGLAVIVPLLEELLKPLWVVAIALAGDLTPTEGFISGAMAGAGFGLAEALFVTQPEQGWSLLFATRLGATLMHTMTSGMVGWGIAEMAANRRLLRLLAGLSGAVLFHGLWNLGALGIASAQLSDALPGGGVLSDLTGALALIGTAIVGMLFLIASAGFFAISHVFRDNANRIEAGPSEPGSRH